MHRRVLLMLAVIALVAVACSDDSASTPTTTAPEASTTTAAPDEEAAPGACPADDFLTDLDGATQPDGYGDVALAVECGDETFTVTSNGLISYEFVAITPNDLAAQDYEFEIPLEPVEADVPGAIGLGSMGVAVNGVVVFSAFEAPQMDYGDPLTDGLLDTCNGHTAPGGQYHYHARFGCLFDDPDEPGLVYGYSFDGYPMIAPVACIDDECAETEAVTSSYVRVDESTTNAFEAWEYQEGAGDLDECNGRVDDDGEYRYYVTDAFPYLPFCFHGETDRAQGEFTGEAPADAGPAGGGGPAV
jgi:hypothetical protein